MAATPTRSNKPLLDEYGRSSTCTATGKIRSPSFLGFETTNRSCPRNSCSFCFASLALKSLVLIGCGDTKDDPNLGALFRWAAVVAAQSEHDHYILLTQSQLSTVSLPIDGVLVPIVYGTEHASLVKFIQNLGRSERVIAHSPRDQPFGTPPAPPSLAVGRVEETKALADAMCYGNGPILVLGGPGVGKTHTLLRALDLVRTDVNRGSIAPLYVRCDLFDSVSSVELRLRAALGLPEGGPFRLAFTRYFQKPVHVVLDNAESGWLPEPLAFEALMAELAATPDLYATVAIRGVRQPAGVAWGERFFISPLAPDEARSLFVELSGASGVEEGLDQVIELAEGLPLVVELLALALPGVGAVGELKRIWDDCSRRLGLLERPPGSSRESSLRTAIEVSTFDFVNDGPEFAVAALLARMPGGMWSRALDHLGPDIAHASRRLCERGLVQGGPHLSMLAPIRAYFEVTTHEPLALARQISAYVCDSVNSETSDLSDEDRHVLDWSIAHMLEVGALDAQVIGAANKSSRRSSESRSAHLCERPGDSDERRRRSCAEDCRGLPV